MTDVFKAVLFPTKPDNEFRHGFGVAPSLPLNQSARAVSHDTARLKTLSEVYA